MSVFTITPIKFSNGLPSRIKVGPIEYEVVLASDLKAEIEDKEVPVFGLVNFRKTEIQISDDLKLDVAWQCLFHELIHIFLEHMGLDDDNEGFVDQLAYNLLAFLLDNGFLKRDEFPAPESWSASIPFTKEKK